MYLCIGFARDLVTEHEPDYFDIVRDSLMQPFSFESNVCITYGKDGLHVGHTAIPKHVCIAKTVTKSRIKFGLLPTGRHILLPVHFCKGSPETGKEAKAIDAVLDIMDEKSPETKFEAFGVGGEDIYVSLSEATTNSMGVHQAEFTLKLHSRIANLYLAEAFAKRGDTSLLTAYLDSYIDALCVYTKSYGGGYKLGAGAMSFMNSIDILFSNAINNDVESLITRKGTRRPTTGDLLWLLRVDHVCHGVLDTIKKYCKKLGSVQEGALQALRDHVAQAESSCPIKKDNHDSMYAIKLLQVLPRLNFPFLGNTRYTRTMSDVVGYDAHTNSYIESRAYCFGGAMLMDVPIRRRREFTECTCVDTDISIEFALECGKGPSTKMGGEKGIY